MSQLEYLINAAKAKGAEQAEAVKIDGSSLSLSYRQGGVESLERSEGANVGLRVLVGKKQAMTSASDLSKDSLDKLVDSAMSMVKVVPDDPFIGLADEQQLAKNFSQFESSSAEVPQKEDLQERARIMEESALDVKGVAQSEGAAASWSKGEIEILTSSGFHGAYESSQQSLSCSVLAGSGQDMQIDYDYSSAVFSEDLLDPAVIGREAGERAVKRLNPRKVETGPYPIVYERRLAGMRLLGPLVDAISGPTVARGTSFLKDQLSQEIFNPSVSIYDDPTIKRGLASRPFDGEGLPTSKQAIIEKGALKTWMLNLHSARQLKLAPTGHASRGVITPPGVKASNFYMEAGQKTPEQLMADISQGFYVTDLMGFGVNGATGDYSMGASGFWIENGVIAYPVSEVTIAGNLKDMYRHLMPANDLVFDSPLSAPTILIESMMVAGL